MKNASGSEKKLAALLKRLPEAAPPVVPEDPITVLVQSFLLWESTSEKAAKAYDKLLAPLVDHNDLRVTMPREMAEFCSDRTVAGLERFRRMRAALRGIYLREHAVTLARLSESGKRDAKKYIDSLDGMVPFVAARVLLLCFDVHGVPVDEHVRSAFIDEGVVDETVKVSDLSGWLTRHTKAGSGAELHARLQAWVDAGAGSGSRRRAGKTTAKPRPKSGVSPATKKTGKTTSKRKTAGKSGKAPVKKTSRKKKTASRR